MDKIVVTCDADLDDIIPVYLKDRAAECPLIRQLAHSGDFGAVRTIAHGMKGSGGCYGFTRISEIGFHMETAAREGQLDGVLEQLGLLEEYLDRIEVCYEQF